MDNAQLDDLKQFIETTVSQTEARLTQRIDAIEKKLDDGFAGIGEAIEAVNQRTDERDAEADEHFTRLEQQAA